MPGSSGGGGAVRISGRLDAPGVAAIRDGLLLRVKALARFQVDASGVEYCDGAVLGPLLELKREGVAQQRMLACPIGVEADTLVDAEREQIMGVPYEMNGWWATPRKMPRLAWE